jgi:3'(2'), 5'-bisphosphate nucleotidase
VTDNRRSLASFSPHVQFAVAVVTASLDLVRIAEAEIATHVLAKVDASPVSVADFAVQAFIAARLARDYGDDPLVAEEDARELRADAALTERVAGLVRSLLPDADAPRVLQWIDRGGGAPGLRCWVLDPIDGTKGLLHGRQYVTALALIEHGQAQIGVIACPRLLRGAGTAVAIRGGGAWWMAGREETLTRLHVSCTRELAEARVLRSWEDAHGDVARLQRILERCGTYTSALRMDSQAKHVTLATGAADVLFRIPPSGHFHEAIWDCAAGTLLIEEAGG